MKRTTDVAAGGNKGWKTSMQQAGTVFRTSSFRFRVGSLPVAFPQQVAACRRLWSGESRSWRHNRSWFSPRWRSDYFTEWRENAMDALEDAAGSDG